MFIDKLARGWLEWRYGQAVRAKLTPEQLARYERIRNTAPELRKIEATEEGKMVAWYRHPSVTDFADDAAGLLDDLGQDAMVAATMVTSPEHGGRLVRIMVEWADKPGLLNRIEARTDLADHMRDLYHAEMKKCQALEAELAKLKAEEDV